MGQNNARTNSLKAYVKGLRCHAVPFLDETAHSIIRGLPWQPPSGNKLLGNNKLSAAASSFLAFWQQQAPSWPLAAAGSSWPFGGLWNSNSRGSTGVRVA
jgi:hypothetical protein